MITELPKNSKMISDYDCPEGEIPEQPVIVSYYEGDGAIGLTGWDGQEVSISYRVVKEVIKTMQAYHKQFNP
jgi:hypothetical protein